MPYKDKNRNLEASRNYKQRNKEKVDAYRKKFVLEKKKWFANYKKNLHCSNCGISGAEYPFILSFHHLELDKKFDRISNMINNTYSIEKIKKEIDKCTVLCENCHRKETIRVRNYEGCRDEERDKIIWYKNFKDSMKCEKCGENDSRCLEFHHPDNNKEEGVGSLANSWCNIERLMDEISKCMCLCANCHRIIHGENFKYNHTYN